MMVIVEHWWTVIVEHWWMVIVEHWWKIEVLGEKPVPLPLCPPQISHKLNQNLTRPYAVVKD
jgi:hypothetical protein